VYSILGIVGILCSIINLICNIFNSWLPKSAPQSNEAKRKYWADNKDVLNARKRAKRKDPIPTIRLELPTGGNDGNEGGDDGNGGGDDGKGDKSPGQKEFYSKIDLIELLLNILSVFLPILVFLNGSPP